MCIPCHKNFHTIPLFFDQLFLPSFFLSISAAIFIFARVVGVVRSIVNLFDQVILKSTTSPALLSDMELYGINRYVRGRNTEGLEHGDTENTRGNTSHKGDYP